MNNSNKVEINNEMVRVYSAEEINAMDTDTLDAIEFPVMVRCTDGAVRALHNVDPIYGEKWSIVGFDSLLGE